MSKRHYSSATSNAAINANKIISRVIHFNSHEFIYTYFQLLRTDKRIARHPERDQQDDLPSKAKIKSHNTTLEVTKPVSPNFTTANRAKASSRRSYIPKPTPVKAFHAKPMPEFNVPNPVKRETSVTSPAPFKFRTKFRGEKHKENLRAAVNESHIEEVKAREFKAKPIKSFSFVATKNNAPAPKPTKVKPFNLETDARGNVSKSRRTQQIYEH